MTSSHVSQKGNVLFLILIAVALFAALSYAVTSSTRSGGGDASKEKMQTDVAAFLDYTASFKSHILRMNIGETVAIDGFNFNTNGRGWTQPCSAAKCTVFNDSNVAGGTLSPPKWLKKEYIIPEYQNQINVNPFGNANLIYVKDLGLNTKAELVFYYPGLTEAFCKQINKALGLGEIAPIDALEAAGSTSIVYEFASTMPEPTSSANTIVGDAAPALAGQKAFCFRNSQFSNSEADYIQVLIER